MYSRSYYPDDGEPKRLPDGYDGVAMRGDENNENRDTGATLSQKYPHISAPPIGTLTAISEEQDDERATADEPSVARKNPWEEDGIAEASARPSGSEQDKSVSAGLFSGIPFLSGLFGGQMKLPAGLGIKKLGLEELLIIGTALLLFFSKNGDKECAILLIAVLFIS